MCTAGPLETGSRVQVKWISAELPCSRGGKPCPQTDLNVYLRTVSSKECPAGAVWGNATVGWDSPAGGKELAKAQIPLSQVVLNFLCPPEGAGCLQGLGTQP